MSGLVVKPAPDSVKTSSSGDSGASDAPMNGRLWAVITVMETGTPIPKNGPGANIGQGTSNSITLGPGPAAPDQASGVTPMKVHAPGAVVASQMKAAPPTTSVVIR